MVKNDYWGLKEDWADIVQDVRIKLYLIFRQNSFRSASSLKTYVYRVAKYTCIDYLRKKYRHQKINIDAVEIAEKTDNFTALVQQEEREMLRLILAKLSERCRKTLRLVFMENLSYKKIASLLNIAEGTVKSRVFRCIKQAIELRKKFTD
ncbi:MAG: sigma-70 family RNA polymerase sigma factor [Calditrichaeota bacterium]|nr:sigma-70 family RNA polymerase sigma factor [Calditrichota bacterium]